MVLDEIPENSTAVGVPARVVKYKVQKDDLDHIHVPDPISQKICELEAKITNLEKKLEKLNK